MWLVSNERVYKLSGNLRGLLGYSVSWWCSGASGTST